MTIHAAASVDPFGGSSGFRPSCVPPADLFFSGPDAMTTRLRRRLPVRTLAAATVALVAFPAAAQEAAVDFGRDVKPILARRCFACHGPDEAEGGLNLTEKASVLAELESGLHAVVPGDADESEIVRRIASTDESERMPPADQKPLTAGEIDVIRRWVAGGAAWDAHWAFKKPTPQTPPAVENEAWVRNPIDRFVLAKLEATGLAPNPEADRRTLVRRAYYDLIGLPPTPEEVEAFAADPDPRAYENLIDRLLDKPQYGERWARHWLDLVRYAETNSYERDGAKPNAWKYRDYVVESLNEDKPYDRFVLEQLAGDELPEVTTESLIATGYYRLGLWDDEPADPLQARYDGLDDLVSTTGQVFLGLTTGCARCHDHKIDPIPAKDYYGLVAFFHELTPYGTRGDQESYSQTDVSPPEVKRRYADLRAQTEAVKKEMEEIERRGIVKMSAPDQRITEGPDRQRLLDAKLADYLEPADEERYDALKAERKRLVEERKALPPRETVLSVAECLPEPPETFVLLRGSPQAPGEKVEPRFPSLFGDEPPQLPADMPGSRSSGRRLALAKWIASPENMLTSRVMANRVWQHHFGRGIVRSTNNFGQLGTPPTHPELLAWLADDFVAGGWTLKRMHRLVMTSAAYRMSSAGNPDALAKDPANDLFWRFDPRRLGAEEIRDATLAVTGKLNLAVGGPWFYPALSQEVLAGQSRPGEGWGKSSEEERNRRSLYIHVKRSLPVPLLTAFDFPETDVSCEARFRTTQPAQALSMLNGEFLNDQARRLAARVRGERPDEAGRVGRALELALSRPATDAEVARGLALLSDLRSKHALDADRAFDLYCLVVLNLNEFVYLD